MKIEIPKYLIFATFQEYLEVIKIEHTIKPGIDGIIYLSSSIEGAVELTRVFNPYIEKLLFTKIKTDLLDKKYFVELESFVPLKEPVFFYQGIISKGAFDPNFKLYKV